jgi:hypothetical protein
MPGRHSINKDRERPAGTAGEQVIERIGVLALGMRRLDRVQRSYMTMRNRCRPPSIPCMSQLSELPRRNGEASA